jgi:hypothetical protein
LDVFNRIFAIRKENDKAEQGFRFCIDAQVGRPWSPVGAPTFKICVWVLMFAEVLFSSTFRGLTF